PTPGPGPSLPDRIFGFDGVDTPPVTPILGPNISQHLPTTHSFDESTPPITLSDIFERPKEIRGVSRPVLRLRSETGVGETHGNVERHGVMGSLDEIVSSSGFEIGDPATEDFYADADVGSRSEASSLSSLWASRAYLDRGIGDLGESVSVVSPGYEHHRNNHNNGTGEVNEKGKHKAYECAYCDPDSDARHGGYFSDSGTATGDEVRRRAGPFVPSFHDSQVAPVKQGSFVFRGAYVAEDDDMHERGGDGGDDVGLSLGCGLDFPLAPRGSGNRRSNDGGARLALPGSGREIHRLPAPVPVCIRRPPTTASVYRGRRRHRTRSPEFISDPSVIQLLTPQGTVGAQFNDVVDVQVMTEIDLLGGLYGMKEIRSNGGYDEVRRGWRGVKGCMVEFKGGDKWELNLKGREAEPNKERQVSSGGLYDGDDEGMIGAASDAEDAVAQLNCQPPNQDFTLGPGEIRPYTLDVIYNDPNKAVSRYTDVIDYSVHLRGAEKDSSSSVRLRDTRGALVIMWKRVARVEIVLVGGEVVEINAGDGRESDIDDGDVVAEGIRLRGGGDKDKWGVFNREKGPESVEKDKEKEQEKADSSPAEDTSGSSRFAHWKEFDFTRGDSLHDSDDESGAGPSKKTKKDKGKGKAVDNGGATPRNIYHSDSEDNGFIPLCYETPTDYVQSLGPPHRIENPEPDYIVGSCPCLDRLITDADTTTDSPQCTCLHPASPETHVPEPWAGGYFSPRYQAFLRDGPPNKPYSHSCTAHSESHDEWIVEAKRKLEENLANQASSSGATTDAAPPNGTSSLPKPLEGEWAPNGSLGENAPKEQRDDAERLVMDMHPTHVSGLDEPSEAPSEAAKLQGSQNTSHANPTQQDNVETKGNDSTNVAGEAARRNTTGGNAETETTTGGNSAGRNTTERRLPQAYPNRHAHGFHSFQGPSHLPMFYFPLPLSQPFHFPGQPTITTIQFFPPHEFPNIHYQYPPPALFHPSMHYNPIIPHSQSSHPQSHPETVHQPIFTLPEIPESNYFYPDGRAARFRFPTTPEQTTGHRQSSGNHEPAPPNATQSPARITQVTASQPALPGPSSGEYNNHLVDEKLVRLVGAFELLRDIIGIIWGGLDIVV
ncbi:hypothetical protein V493_08095, partial [Pseudogymnoascus sp. VKM F-4281 (FW-2241)]